MTAPLPAQTLADDLHAARSRSNQAIVDRDLPAYTATITQDFVITTGAGAFYDRPGFLALWTKQFRDLNWQGCVRTTDKVEISSTSDSAAEHGHFVCRSRQAGGVASYSGTYLALWRREATAWKTRSELFVTLASTAQ